MILVIGGLGLYFFRQQSADIAYEVTIKSPADGFIDVVMKVPKNPAEDLVLLEREVSENLRLTNLVAWDEQGARLKISVSAQAAEGHKRLSSRNIYTVASKGAGGVSVAYRVRPGAFGKHGHHGYLDDRFGLVYGHLIFLCPVSLPDAKRIAVRFILPSGWEALTPWRRSGGVFVIDSKHYSRNTSIFDLLGKPVIGFGRFTQRRQQIRGLNIRVYVFGGWSDRHKKSIYDQVFRLARYQLDLFDARAQGDYLVVFVPLARDGKRVFGGCSTWGQGFEMEQVTNRRWELFLHRLHHVFNAYQPLGLAMDNKSSGWFLEATATYYEMKALASLGFYKLEDRLAQLKRQYAIPTSDIELSRDYIKPFEIEDRVQRYDAVEYLHYAKAPFVAYLIDQKIGKDTKGQKDLDGFLRYIYAKHGMMRGAVNLKKELAVFTETDFSDFFRKYVENANKNG